MRMSFQEVCRLGLIAAGLFFVVTLLVAAGPPPDPEEEAIASGRFLYRVYCMNCHGEAGRGDGVSAPLLKIEPSDLTRLARENEGDFPAERIYGVIDGREEVRGHGSRRMPIWGFSFQELDSDVNQEDQVRQKILHVIDYLESIQGSPKR